MKRSSQRTVMAEGRYLRLVNWSGWEFAERSRGLEAVAIVAVTREKELILTEQFRVPLGKSVVDLPAGLVGDEGEDTLESAASRELEEETGFKARSFRRVFSGPTSAGLSNEVLNLLFASGVTKVGDGGGVSGESIKVHVVKLDRLLGWIRRYEKTGGMVSPNVLVALALLQNRSSKGR
jgi:ADP-ribose pyrophosphatase